MIYVCLLDSDGKVLLHEQTKANPESLMALIEPYLDNLLLPSLILFL
ncbi:MAG: hypothetical protein KZQ74_08930 [gamma proteobacterium symbiont of Bathyaustriella thionipta]|nr:hypothetical protein [gamma proteobacterium symbiont of Bathyaustriella thionipta]MCU7951692.1 hypothetical protein [gamma proteobacterium symbiont of Bathyaustriella thionipta]MCU7958291.1 hypothetical protein [gamma proteobacterium symbiont of Bathyaustriella thionipta]MCU7967299.1 hypothetical protein [gamma proteobacterium symbiont of Bathyaustriella thionipta]